MSSKIDISHKMINKTGRSSSIRLKENKKKSELISESENKDKNAILLISESSSDAVLERSGMSDSDIEFGGNVTSYITLPTCVTYHTVEVILDIPTFVGSDEQCYTLKTGDRVIVPTDQAKILFNRGMAVLVDEAVKFRGIS